MQVAQEHLPGQESGDAISSQITELLSRRLIINTRNMNVPLQLFLNMAPLTLSPSVSLPLSLSLTLTSWKSEIIIPAVKCNSLSHKMVLDL